MFSAQRYKHFYNLQHSTQTFFHLAHFSFYRGYDIQPLSFQCGHTIHLRGGGRHHSPRPRRRLLRHCADTRWRGAYHHSAPTPPRPYHHRRHRLLQERCHALQPCQVATPRSHRHLCHHQPSQRAPYYAPARHGGEAVSDPAPAPREA